MPIPMVLPPAVAGVALLMAFGRRGILGSFLSDAGLELAFTQTAAVLAQLFVAGPFYVKAAIAGFAKVEQDVEEAAAIDGAQPWQVFRRITVPLAWPALTGGVDDRRWTMEAASFMRLPRRTFYFLLSPFPLPTHPPQNWCIITGI